MQYMQWAKLHPRVRYELTASGMPALTLVDLGLSADGMSLEITAPYGDETLRDAVAARYELEPTQVLPIASASFANFVALAAAAPAGGRVLIEHPAYEPMFKAAEVLKLDVGRLPRRVEPGCPVDLDALRDLLRQPTAAVLITNLHNPTGQYLPPATVREMATLCHEHGTTLIVDEVYLDAHWLTGRGERWTALTAGDNLVTTNSLTKLYGLGGLRIGWLGGPPALLERAKLVVDAVSPCLSAPAETIGREVLLNLAPLEERFRRAYEQGQPVFRHWLAEEQRVTGYPSCGAIFEAVRLPAGIRAHQLRDHLVQHHDTQVTPGAFFDMDDHVRIFIAGPPEDLAEGLQRVSAALTELS